jgi:hypothetical protein
MKLFIFYVGGDCKNSNIELHDVRFCIGSTPEDCYDNLRRQWWGDPRSLHLDCWGEIEQADGFDVEIVATHAQSLSNRLFFVNLGGYVPDQFEELHRNILLVAIDAKAAMARAREHMHGWSAPHRDNIFEVEKALNLSEITFGQGFSLVLRPATVEKPFRFICKYLKLGDPGSSPERTNRRGVSRQ